LELPKEKSNSLKPKYSVKTIAKSLKDLKMYKLNDLLSLLFFPQVEQYKKFIRDISEKNNVNFEIFSVTNEYLHEEKAKILK
jgi:hypothetical protein